LDPSAARKEGTWGSNEEGGGKRLRKEVQSWGAPRSRKPHQTRGDMDGAKRGENEGRKTTGIARE